jgi:tripartite-type tricarboxylate transporter receptor subunit TctC
VTDLIGGQVPMMFSDLIAVLRTSGRHAAHHCRRIVKRVSLLPDVKTVAEQGFGFDATSWAACSRRPARRRKWSRA